MRKILLACTTVVAVCTAHAIGLGETNNSGTPANGMSPMANDDGEKIFRTAPRRDIFSTVSIKDSFGAGPSQNTTKSG